MAAFTNTTENGLESLIVKWLVDHNGYEEGSNADYNKEYAIDETRLFRFLQDTQPDQMDKLGVFKSEQKKRQFLNRLQGELAKRGIIDVLRNGIKVYPVDLIMFYLTPTENNTKAREMFEKNIFSITRQLRYSQDAGKLALDTCLFINGLPVITFELKNQLTKQNADDAVQQYKDDRDPREVLFSFKRCMVHFAVDDTRIKFCTKLSGKDSWFLPFDKGYNDGAGNPPNPDGIMTDYLWKNILTKAKLTRIIENYAQVIEETDPETKKKSIKQVFPRYHQLDVVESLLADVKENGVGKKYLIQHSAGSGKSNSIAWLAHQLIGLEKDGHPMIDSVIVVTDRRILDKQIRDTIKQFMQVANTVAWAEHSGDLRKAITDGKRIIVTTIEKFPYVVPEIGADHKDNHFAIIIDEAHSGQSGRNSAQMNLALSGLASDDEMDNEDKINAMMEGRRLLNNASYFAFTATPKNKTLETFGVAYQDGDEIKHRPFHVYTMKQAIQEGFILDVLQHYTTIDSFYKLMKTVEDDPMFDKKRAQKKLRSFVESNEYTIAKKAAMMVDHFHEQVIAKGKIGGQARAMVVTSSIPRCVEYYYAINKCLADRHSPYKTIVAFSGEHKYQGQEPALTSAALNGFPDAKIPSTLKSDPYRILIVADMFQTGFDEPLLHTMYVDKMLYDIKAVQTLSRLNRCHPKKHDTFVLDFANKPEMIQSAFSTYYRTTLLSGETDPNKLYDLIATMEEYQVYSQAQVNISLDQTRKLRAAILADSNFSYPTPEPDGSFSIDKVLEFLIRLGEIFDWKRYEYSTLGKCDEDGDYTKLRWYAVILVQWMEGKGLNYIMRRAVEYQERHPEKFWVNRYTKIYYNRESLEHRNIVFANTLEVIENIILFSISNYFLRFSNEYKRVHGENALNKNNWYEYVEYGTTNEVTIQLQRYGFSRESANYIRTHQQYYLIDNEGNVRVKNSLESCGDKEVEQQIPDIRFNTPELFIDG